MKLEIQIERSMQTMSSNSTSEQTTTVFTQTFSPDVVDRKDYEALKAELIRKYRNNDGFNVRKFRDTIRRCKNCSGCNHCRIA